MAEAYVPRCATCRHWDPRPDETDWSVCRWIGAFRRGDGSQLAQVDTNDDPQGVTLLTSGAFGCIEWVARSG
jgi:hypothetical protein